MQNELFKFLDKTFKENGFSIFEVGGSVSDELLGLEVFDFDFATDAIPEEMMKFLPKLPKTKEAVSLHIVAVIQWLSRVLR